jgi:hypothetical protein
MTKTRSGKWNSTSATSRFTAATHSAARVTLSAGWQTAVRFQAESLAVSIMMTSMVAEAPLPLSPSEIVAFVIDHAEAALPETHRP